LKKGISRKTKKTQLLMIKAAKPAVGGTQTQFSFTNWISSLSALGLLVMTVWAGFFSDFSKIIEASLRDENSRLKISEQELKTSIEELENQKANLQIEVSALNLKVTKENKALKKAKQQLTDQNKLLTLERREVQKVKSERKTVLNELKTAVRIQALQSAPYNWGEQKLPSYVALKLNSARSGTTPSREST